LKTRTHRGDLSLTQATWMREAAPPITAIGGVKYDWPAGFETRGLRVKMNEQTVALEAALSGGLLDLREFLWSDGTTELASGTASLPVPADFSKWRDTLANDTRALSVSIDSRVLSLALLKPPGEWGARGAAGEAQTFVVKCDWEGHIHVPVWATPATLALMFVLCLFSCWRQKGKLGQRRAPGHQRLPTVQEPVPTRSVKGAWKEDANDEPSQCG
jgi:hypothetical protein